MPIELGDEVRDTISGFTGIVIGRTEWLYGCVRIGVSPRKVNKESGKIIDAQWFDEPQLEVLTPRKKPNKLSGGGPDRHEEKR